jgi:hypothetical protein
MAADHDVRTPGFDSLLGSLCAAVLSLAACGGVEVQPGADGAIEPDPPDASVGGPDARPATCENGVTQLLYNPSFEEAENPDGAIGWSEQSMEGEHLTFPEDQLGGFAVYEGNRAAWLGRAFADDQRLSQTVAVPATTTSLSLSFYRCFTTEEDQEAVYDTLDVSLLDAGGAALGPPLVSYDNLDADDKCSWELVELDIAAIHAGEEIALQLRADTDGDILTSFFFDAVALTALGPCPDDVR